MKKASITLYLCLTLSVFLSLTAVSFYSARISAGRVVLASALEEGMYSLFGEYDTELFRRYGLLFIDGGRGQTSLQLHRLTGRAEQYASYILDPGKGSGSKKSLVPMSAASASITAYTLATDGAGSAFSRQICTAMEGKVASNAARLMAGKLEQAGTLSGEQQAQVAQILSDSSTSEADLAAAENIDLGEAYQDPREAVTAARKTGILRLAVPAGKVISGQTADLSQMPSVRVLQRGIGGITQQQAGVADRALLAEYGAEFFTDFSSADAQKNDGLHYQLEYLICRKGSDAENLKGTLDRLMVMREAANLAFLSANPAKRAETLAAATAVTTAIGMPYLAPVAAVGIRAAWAYAEGVFDLRRLLSGKKVSLVKTEANWQLSVRELPHFLDSAGTGGAEDADGLTYDQYLRMLLLSRSRSDLTMGLMDLIEDSVKRTEGKSSFRIDNCIDAMRMELSVTSAGKRLVTGEQYGYGME